MQSKPLLPEGIDALRALAVGGLVLLVIVMFHSPRLWILLQGVTPGTFEWTRAIGYFAQIEYPFTTDIEAAMRWRFVPQVFVYLLGRNALLAMLVPWLGAVVLIAYVYALACRRVGHSSTALSIAVLFGATAPVLVSTGWVGVNDSWVIAALLYVAFGRRVWLLCFCCLLAPFIDERFIFGLPSCFLIRCRSGFDRRAAARTLLLALGLTAVAIAPYLVLRFAGVLFRGVTPAADMSFYLSNIRAAGQYLHVAPLGLWMALRCAYFPMLSSSWHLWKREGGFLLCLLAAIATPVCAGMWLAADTMRTGGIIVPVALWAAFRCLEHDWPVPWKWLAIGNLLIPAAHVTATKVVPINSLPVEVLRLL